MVPFSDQSFDDSFMSQLNPKCDTNNKDEIFPRVIRLDGPNKIRRFFTVFGDDILQIVTFVIFSVLILVISFSSTSLQTNRIVVALIFSIGGDLAMHIFITSSTYIVLAHKIKKGIPLDDLINYLSILASPKSQFRFLKKSVFVTTTILLIMHYAVEMTLNYSLPNQPSLAAGQFRKHELILSPLGGGILLNRSQIRTNPQFKFSGTGLSLLASPSNADNTAYFTQKGNELTAYHLPHQLFKSGDKNLITKTFTTLGYIGTLKRSKPTSFSLCTAASTESIETNCSEVSTERGTKLYYNITNIPRKNPKRSDIHYQVSFQNVKSEHIFGRNWTYSISLTRSLINIKCDKREGIISCTVGKNGKIIAGENWIKAKNHVEDIKENMQSCFHNILRVKFRSEAISESSLVARLIVAMLTRDARYDTVTGSLATSQLPGKYYVEIADAYFTYRGPWMLRFFLVVVLILAYISLIWSWYPDTPVPVSLISIISALGNCVNDNRAACISERRRAFEGLEEVYRKDLRVYAGLTAGQDLSINSKCKIKLTRGAGPRKNQVASDSECFEDLAHFEISTLDKIVLLSDIPASDLSQLILGHMRRENKKGKKLKTD